MAIIPNNELYAYRMTKESPTTWSPIKSGGKPFYIPANTRFAFLYITYISFRLAFVHTTFHRNNRIAYSVYAMHRRVDLWGPDGQFFGF